MGLKIENFTADHLIRKKNDCFFPIFRSGPSHMGS